MLGLHAGSVASWLGERSPVRRGRRWASRWCRPSAGSTPPARGSPGRSIVGASMAGVGLVAPRASARSPARWPRPRAARTRSARRCSACFYVLRMIGDLGDGRLTWASPDRVGPGDAAVGRQPLVAARPDARCSPPRCSRVATRLEARRDLGAGLLPERAGPRRRRPPATPRRSGLGLRLQRGPIIGWTLTIAAQRAAVRLRRRGDDRPAWTTPAGRCAADAPGHRRRRAAVACSSSMIAMITTVFAIQSAVSLRADEASGIIEPQLAGALSRTRWAAAAAAHPRRRLGGAAARRRRRHGRRLRLDHRRLAARPAAWRWPPWPTGRPSWCSSAIAVALFGWLPRLAIAADLGRPGRDVVRRAHRRRAAPARLAARPAAVLGHPVPAARAADLDAAGRHDPRRRGAGLGRASTASPGATCSPADPAIGREHARVRP